MLEPGNSPLPGGVVPSFVYTVKPLFPVQVVLSWVLCPVESLSLTEVCEMKFQRISAGVKVITVTTVERQVLANPLTNFLAKSQLGGTAEQQVELKALL